MVAGKRKKASQWHIVESNVGMFPLYLYGGKPADTLFAGSERPNLSLRAAKYLKHVGDAESLFLSSLAILHSPEYRKQNATALRLDWPRLPLPSSRDRLAGSAGLGEKLAALLDPGAKVEGVTTGPRRPELKQIAIISREDGGSLNPAKGHLAVTAGWGHVGKDGAVMPGKGLAKTRDYTASELAALEQGAAKLEMTSAQTLKLLGEQTLDIYLNDIAYWKNIPNRVRDYTIGGYQVIKKWLSYRERDLLGRDLTADEVDEVTAMVRRVAAIILLEPALDENYQVTKAATYGWISVN